jgi:catechol 2,3-dioxygenase-like lactoylglutathione lyase family enzyme
VRPSSIRGTLFILYVASQEDSTVFYGRVLDMEPSLHVPGMTEFTLSEGCRLGLMPAKGIMKLLGEALPNPEAAAGIPRAEVYLLVDDPEVFHQRALANGATELSPLAPRDWGDIAAYSLDPDGHVLVFARPETEQPGSA